MNTTPEIERAVLEMQRTAHNTESLNYSMHHLEDRLGDVERKIITAWRKKTIRDRTVGIVTRESLEARSEKYDLDGLVEAREMIERDLALNLDQIDKADAERVLAVDEVKRVCTYD